MSSLLQYHIPSEEFLGREIVDLVDESMPSKSRLGEVIMESTFKVKHPGDWYSRKEKNYSEVNWFLSPYGYVDYLGEWHHNQEAAKMIKDCKWSEDYKKYHEKLNYDPAEYLVAVKGFIACSDGKLIYNPSLVTKSQVKELYGHSICRTRETKGKQYFVPMPENTNQHYYDCPTEKQHAYYRESRNRFHCPSGFIRVDYENYLAACREWGIRPSDGRSNRFSFS